MGRSAATRAGQPGRRAQTRLRHHAGRGADHGRTAQRGDPLRGDRASRGSRPDRAARIRRPSSALSDHGGRRRGSGPAIRADEQGRLAGPGAAEHQPGLGRSMRRPAQVPSATLLCRAALAAYPPSWRARYADEVRALLDDSGASPAAVASLAWRAVPAWVWPSRALYDSPSRMRASLSWIQTLVTARYLSTIAGALPGYLSVVITVQAAAVQAAARVAAGLGVTSDEPVVLADGANVIVHLRPSPVVAKVAASTAAVRADTAGWLKRELDLAQFLAAAGVPVMTPSPEIPATTYHGDGLVMSFWRYLRSSGGARSD